MNALNTFVIVSTIVNLMFAVVWTRNSPVNIVIKVMFWLIAFNGGYVVFTNHLLG